MPLFEYRCPNCGSFLSQDRATWDTCHLCTRASPRIFSFRIGSSIQEHFNHTIGSYVSNEKELNDAFKVKTEEMTLRTGFEHDLQPIHPATLATKSAHGVTTAGLDQTYRTLHDKAVK